MANAWGNRPLFAVGLLGVLGLAFWKRRAMGATAFISHAQEEKVIRRTFADYAEQGGLNADFVLSIVKVESDFRMNAVNKTGRDGKRGGAWGPTQITEKTVRALGYKGLMEAFTKDVNLAALWTVKILNDSRKRMPLTTLADYVAAWNAGKDDADKNNDGELEELSPEHLTRKDYLPKAKLALVYVQATKGRA
jgi:soluble lytic murein transglycosylase-like protein